MYKFWQKRDWNCAFIVPPNTHALMKRRDAPLQPPEIIYFCKFRPKRARNYGYLVCKIQNFLRQGGTAPLQPHTYTFWQKRDWNCAFMHGFSKYAFSYEKKSRPLQPPAIIHFCKFRPQRAWKYAYLACQIQNFLTQGGAPLQPPPGGASPLDPREHLAQALSLLASLAVVWTPH